MEPGSACTPSSSLPLVTWAHDVDWCASYPTGWPSNVRSDAPYNDGHWYLGLSNLTGTSTCLEVLRSELLKSSIALSSPSPHYQTMYALDGSDVSLHAYLPRSPQWKSNPSRDSINRRMLDDIRRHSVRVRRALLAADYDAWSAAAKELVYTVLRLSEWEHAWAAEDGAVDYSQAVARLTRIREEWMSRVSTKSFTDAHIRLGGGSEPSDADVESQRARSPVTQEQRVRRASHSRWPAHDDDAGTPWVEPRRHEPRNSDPRTTTGGVQGGLGIEQAHASFTPPSPPHSARSASTMSPWSSSATPTDTGMDRSTRRRGRHARRSSQAAGAAGESSQDAVALMNVVRDLTERLRSPSASSRSSSGGPPLSNTLQDLSRVLNQLNDVSAHQGRPKRSRKRHDRAASQQ